MADADTIIHATENIPTRMLSVALSVDVRFTKGHDTKRGSGSGFLLMLPDKSFPFKNDFVAGLPRLAGFAVILVYVTCRHVVDYAYGQPKESESYGWNLSGVTVRHFNEHGKHLAPAEFVPDDICVLVPKSERLDLALVAVDPRSAGFKGLWDKVDPRSKLIKANVNDLSDGTGMCRTLPWGAEVGFTSIQPWTNGYPILRSGRLASDPRTDFVSPDIDKDDVYLLEAQSFSGSSGAPVIAYPIGHPVFEDFRHGDGSRFEKYRHPHLVGIMAGHIRNTKSESGELNKLHVGLSYCHKIGVLERMVMGREPMVRIA